MSGALFQVFVLDGGSWLAEGKPFADCATAMRWAESYDPTGRRVAVRRVHA